MEFHRFSTCFTRTKQRHPKTPPRDVFYREGLRQLSQMPMSSDAFGANAYALLIEANWWDNLRPYYNLYPGIVDALLRVRLNVPATSLLQLPKIPLSLRLATEHVSPLLQDRYPLRAALLWLHDPEQDLQPVSQRYGVPLELPPEDDHLLLYVALDWGLPAHQTAVAEPHSFARALAGQFTLRVPRHGDRTVEEMAERVIQNTAASAGPGSISDVLSPQQEAVFRSVLRLCLAVTLLPRDSELITPDVLNDDRAKLGQGRDEELQQKAARRRGGEIGWDVGREIWEKREISPHYRNPHLAHFWVGEGRTKCILKLRAGAVVQRHLLRQVPTGYESLEDNGRRDADE